MDKALIMHGQVRQDWTGCFISDEDIINDKISILECVCKNDRFGGPNHMKECISISINSVKRKFENISITINKKFEKDELETKIKLLFIEF